jgi:hypothetical protein
MHSRDATIKIFCKFIKMNNFMYLPIVCYQKFRFMFHLLIFIFKKSKKISYRGQYIDIEEKLIDIFFALHTFLKKNS